MLDLLLPRVLPPSLFEHPAAELSMDDSVQSCEDLRQPGREHGAVNLSGHLEAVGLSCLTASSDTEDVNCRGLRLWQAWPFGGSRDLLDNVGLRDREHIYW
jgi:hypothetical protein